MRLHGRNSAFALGVVLALTTCGAHGQDKKSTRKFDKHLACARSISDFAGYGLFPLSQDVVLIPHTNDAPTKPLKKDESPGLPYAQGFYALTGDNIYFFAFPPVLNTGTYYLEIKVPGKENPLVISYKYRQTEPPVVSETFVRDPSHKDEYAPVEPEPVSKDRLDAHLRRELWKRIAHPGRSIEEKKAAAELWEKKEYVVEGLKVCGKITTDAKLKELAVVQQAKVGQFLASSIPANSPRGSESPAVDSEVKSEKNAPSSSPGAHAPAQAPKTQGRQ